MSQLRSFAGLIAVLALGVGLFAVSASASHQSAAAACKTFAGGHRYAITHQHLTCAKAQRYVRRVAVQHPDGSRLPSPPSGYRCQAYINKKGVQTYGFCQAKSARPYFDWTKTS